MRTALAQPDRLRDLFIKTTLICRQYGSGNIALMASQPDRDIRAIQKMPQIEGSRTVVGTNQQSEQLA